MTRHPFAAAKTGITSKAAYVRRKIRSGITLKLSKMIPSTKISQTILEFGKPLINQLPQDHTKEEFETAITLVIVVWNAIVMDTWNKKNKYESDLLKRISAEPKQYQLVIKRLLKRKKKKFGKDPRGIGNHWVREENGEFIFGCEARLDVANVPTTGNLQ